MEQDKGSVQKRIIDKSVEIEEAIEGGASKTKVKRLQGQIGVLQGEMRDQIREAAEKERDSQSSQD